MIKSGVPDSLILSHAELCTLTGRTRFSAQAKAIAVMGINYRIRPDGFPVVSRAHFEAIMGAETTLPSGATTEPDWTTLNAT